MQQKDWQVRISAGANDCTQLCGGGKRRTGLQQSMKTPLQSKDVLSGPQCFCFRVKSVKGMHQWIEVKHPLSLFFFLFYII